MAIKPKAGDYSINPTYNEVGRVTKDYGNAVTYEYIKFCGNDIFHGYCYSMHKENVFWTYCLLTQNNEAIDKFFSEYAALEERATCIFNRGKKTNQ